MSAPSIGSLCTGILGLDRAVAQHFGAELAWYSEIEPAACTVIEREHPGVPNLGDLKVIDWATVPPVDILTAGYPCQPFSHAGKRKGTDDPRHLWPWIANAVRVLRPRHVVLENVRGHLSKGFDVVLGSLAEAGFDAEWCLLRASDVGACHQRARVFIVARNTDSASPHTHAEAGSSRDRAGESGRSTAADASDLRHERRGSARRGGHGPADGGDLAADANGASGEARHGRPGARDSGRLQPVVGGDPVAWGKYEPAIRRWERVFGQPAPRPVDDKGRLSPALVGWMMGYPEGWVDGLTRTQALKALGNAVVTQQALAALRELCPVAAPVPAMPVDGVPLHLPTPALLPTPVVNDMGGRKTPEQWDAWCDEMRERHGNGNGHGPSLSVEAQRIASPVPTW